MFGGTWHVLSWSDEPARCRTYDEWNGVDIDGYEADGMEHVVVTGVSNLAEAEAMSELSKAGQAHVIPATLASFSSKRLHVEIASGEVHLIGIGWRLILRPADEVEDTVTGFDVMVGEVAHMMGCDCDRDTPKPNE